MCSSQDQYMLYILYNIIFLESSMLFPVISWLVTITVTVWSDVTDVWQYDHDVTLALTLDPNKENKRKTTKTKETSIQALYVWHVRPKTLLFCSIQHSVGIQTPKISRVFAIFAISLLLGTRNSLLLE